ncbi:MAG TPA: hypothetical protein VGM65_01825 [Candidatus Udaeobacter sp.]|jgi:hypothetical protein
MASFIRQGVVAVSLAIVLFSTSCEKHPLGEMPEVQREQPDPAKVWSGAAEQNSEASSPSATPNEASHQAR